MDRFRDEEFISLLKNTIEGAVTSAVPPAVDKTVNGKIDALRKIVEEYNERREADIKEVREHIEEVRPILEAYTGLGTLGNLAKWLGGIIVTIGAVWALFFKQ